MYHKPDDPISFMELCLARARNSKDGVYDWKLFHSEGGSLTPDLLNQLSIDSGHDSHTEKASTQLELVEQRMKEVLTKPILFVLGTNYILRYHNAFQ